MKMIVQAISNNNDNNHNEQLAMPVLENQIDICTKIDFNVSKQILARSAGF